MSQIEKKINNFVNQEGIAFLPYLKRVNSTLYNIFESKKCRFGKLTESQRKEIISVKKAFNLRLSLGEARFLIFAQQRHLSANYSEWKNNRNQYFSTIEREAKKHKIPTPIFNALIDAESEYKPEAINPDSKATGLGQISPETAEKDYGVSETQLRDPEINLSISADYLRKMYELYSSKENKKLSELDRWKLAIAAYNWGFGNVNSVIDDAGFTVQTLPSFKYIERHLPSATQEHIKKIMQFTIGC